MENVELGEGDAEGEPGTLIPSTVPFYLRNLGNNKEGTTVIDHGVSGRRTADNWNFIERSHSE